MASSTTLHKTYLGSRPTIGVGLLFVFIILLVACNRQGTVVSNLQIGANGSSEAFVGQPLPIAAQLAGNTTITHVDVDIQPSSGEGWTFNEQFTEGIAGKSETPFSAEVAIPMTVEPGSYKLSLRLTEDDGTVTEESADFRITIDSSVPTASDLDVGINAAGNDLHLETELAAPAGIKRVLVEVKGDDWEKEFEFSGEKLVGQLTNHFHEHVHVSEAPKGSYRVILTVEDQKDRRTQTEGTFTK